MDKVVATALEAVADVPDGASLAVGGFGLSGVPDVLIRALHERGVLGLGVVSNNCGAMESGLAVLLVAGRIARVTSSCIGGNKEFARQYPADELEVELIPQGTSAERLRAGGARCERRGGRGQDRRRTDRRAGRRVKDAPTADAVRPPLGRLAPAPALVLTLVLVLVLVLVLER
ncbi:CoA transferase subunit A [Streptomyces sp. NPDC002519]